MKRNNVVSLNKVVSASADAFIAYGTNNQELILRFHGNPGHVLDRTPHTCFIGTDETGRVATCRQGRKKTDQTNNGMIISFQAEDELSYLDGPTLITVQSCD